MDKLIDFTVLHRQKRLMYIFVVMASVAVSVWFFGSKGTIDTRNWEVIFWDIMIRGRAFIPDCLNYICPSNLILTKFPPGHALIFYMFSLIFPVSFFGTLIATKALIALFYIATLGAIVWFGRSVGEVKLGLLRWTALYAGMFSLVLSTQGLAYTDILAFPFLVISVLYLMKEKLFWSGCLFGMSCLVKWQPIILLPIILTYMFSGSSLKGSITRVAHFSGGLFVSVMLLYPFTQDVGAGLLLSLRNVLLHTATYALNVSWVIQNLPFVRVAVSTDASPTQSWAWVQLGVFSLCYALVCWRVFRHAQKATRQEGLLHSFLLGTFIYYLFSFGVHENHFILGSVIALLLYFFRPTRANYFILRFVDAINILNLVVFYGFTGVPFFGEHRQGVDSTVVLAGIISLGGLVYLWRVFFPKSTLFRFIKLRTK